MDWVKRIVLLTGLLAGMAQALYGPDHITAFRVADNKIVVDGKPDSAWREVAGLVGTFGGSPTIAFNNYGKIVLLGPDSLRNADPKEHYQAPETGSVTFLAAYDAAALYFFFIVRENNAFNPASAGCAVTDLWKAHGAEVYVDPSAYNTSLYSAYFSADAGEVSYGTSSKTLQMAKPALPSETREYYRDRTSGNLFSLRTGSGAKAVSVTRSTSDPSTYGIEMRIPYPAAADFTPGKSMFISWGYNHFPDAPRTDCAADPIAYRWAKHEKDYSDSTKKPPGWRAGDKIHYDPLRSWDGWGRFHLDNSMPGLTGSNCRGKGIAESDWSLPGSGACGSAPVHARIMPKTENPSWSLTLNPALPAGASPLRDIRGRMHAGKSRQLLVEPLPAPASRD